MEGRSPHYLLLSNWIIGSTLIDGADLCIILLGKTTYTEEDLTDYLITTFIKPVNHNKIR